ncbi:MAG TPA: hypothetical protein VFP89_00780 [Propionibacteriaceae bacterium]|nr:hypothetical protein [Propionibacteriaceae bacterium]
MWEWGRRSNGRAVDNARGASTRLSRLRVEREEVELYLRQRFGETGDRRVSEGSIA